MAAAAVPTRIPGQASHPETVPTLETTSKAIPNTYDGTTDAGALARRAHELGLERRARDAEFAAGGGPAGMAGGNDGGGGSGLSHMSSAHEEASRAAPGD